MGPDVFEMGSDTRSDAVLRPFCYRAGAPPGFGNPLESVQNLKVEWRAPASVVPPLYVIDVSVRRAEREPAGNRE